MEQPDTSRLRATVQAYSDSWGVTDPAERRALFERSIHPTFAYCDPLAQLAGYDALAGYMTDLHQQVPGVRFVVTDFQTHHDRLLIHWDMLAGDGQVLSKGASYGQYGADGRLTQMNGFWAG